MSSGVYRSARNFLLLVFVAISISACAHRGDNVSGPNIPDYVVPFSIGFDREGNPVIFDEKGNDIDPKFVDFPIESKEIQSVSTISAIAVKGSCFYLLQFGGNTRQIELPDWYCNLIEQCENNPNLNICKNIN